MIDDFQKAQLIIDELSLKVEAEPFWNEVVSRSWELLHESTLMPGTVQILRRFFQIALTLIREILGPSLSAFSGKKSRIITGDVTDGT